jgi:hypothetical protein
MMTRDLEPFAQFQVDYPLLPSVIFNVADLDAHYHAILDAVEFSVDNWPDTPKPTLSETFRNLMQSSNLNQTMFEQDDTSVSSASSMPPLGVQTRSQTRRHLFFDDGASTG